MLGLEMLELIAGAIRDLYTEEEIVIWLPAVIKLLFVLLSGKQVAQQNFWDMCIVRCALFMAVKRSNLYSSWRSTKIVNAIRYYGLMLIMITDLFKL